MYVSNPCGGQYEIHTKLLHRSPYSSFLGSVKVRYKWKQIHWWLMRCWDILISELRYYLLKKQPFECDMQFFESIAWVQRAAGKPHSDAQTVALVENKMIDFHVAIKSICLPKQLFWWMWLKQPSRKDDGSETCVVVVQLTSTSSTCRVSPHNTLVTQKSLFAGTNCCQTNQSQPQQ